MKKTIALLLMLLMLSAPALGESSSLAAARLLIPEEAMLTESERDDGFWEYEFRNGDIFYEVIMDGETPLSLVTKNKALRPAKTNTLTREQALADVEGEVLYAQAQREDGGWIWKIIFKTETDLMEYDLHAETGEMLESEIYFSLSIELPARHGELDLEWDDGRLEWDRD